MVGRANSHLESNLIPARDSQRAQTNLVHTRTQISHRDGDRTVFECLLWRYRSAMACFRVGSSECSSACMGPFEGGRHFLHYLHHSFSSLQSLSRARLFATPWTAARQASLCITNSRSFFKLMSTEGVMPSNHLILYHPPLLLASIFPRIRVFSNKSALPIKWPKYLCFHM